MEEVLVTADARAAPAAKPRSCSETTEAETAVDHVPNPVTAGRASKPKPDEEEEVECWGYLLMCVGILLGGTYIYAIFEVGSNAAHVLGRGFGGTCSGNCSFVDGHAVAWWTDNLDARLVQTRQECCNVCGANPNCSAATFYGSDSATPLAIRSPTQIQQYRPI